MERGIEESLMMVGGMLVAICFSTEREAIQTNSVLFALSLSLLTAIQDCNSAIHAETFADKPAI